MHKNNELKICDKCIIILQKYLKLQNSDIFLNIHEKVFCWEWLVLSKIVIETNNISVWLNLKDVLNPVLVG
jgi:hypothetical protein